MTAIQPIQLHSAKAALTNTRFAPAHQQLEQLENVKAAIRNEFRDALEAHEHLLHLALNEAEALAWQSGVPELVFPTLAREKAQTVVSWHARQRALQSSGSEVAFAA